MQFFFKQQKKHVCRFTPTQGELVGPFTNRVEMLVLVSVHAGHSKLPSLLLYFSASGVKYVYQISVTLSVS